MSLDIQNFGCRLNALDGDYIRQAAQQAGLTHATIINSCAVTTQAVRQARQAVRKAAKTSKQNPIIVTGCAVQLHAAQFAAMPQVNRLIGNVEKKNPAAYRKHAQPIQVSNIMQADANRPDPETPSQARARAFVQVQTGCNHRCTFCVIPFGRGNARSRRVGDIVRDCRALVAQGHKEIVLTGVDITSWGADIGEAGLASLVRAVLDAVPQLPRLRLSSLDVAELTPAMLDIIAQEARLMPHLHLSLQAGDDMILKRMKRRHTRAQAVAFCQTIKRRRPDIVFGADIIAGFPTETDAMFNQSLKLVRECELVWLHVFPFSPRPDTPAARMPQVPPQIIKTRAAALRKAGDSIRKTWLDSQRGRQLPILLETPHRGRSEHFAQIDLTPQAHAMPAKTLTTAYITGHNGAHLQGNIVL